MPRWRVLAFPARAETRCLSITDLLPLLGIGYREGEIAEPLEVRPTMHVEMRPISSIKPYENNPRLNDAGVDAVAASIREFGFRQPIVVDEDGVIIVGHTRFKAALKLGLEMVPVHVAVGMTPAQAKAYRIADNQTATLSSWDADRLPIELAQLQEMNFDLNMTLFSADELLRLL